jgi:dUTPase
MGVPTVIDVTQDEETKILAAPLDPGLPLGLAAPQKEGDVGWDLVAAVDVVIGPGDAMDVPVNLRMQLPTGWYADIRNRSSMARRGLYVDQNLVDGGYRGPLFVFIRNMALPQMRAIPDAQMAAMINGSSRIVVPGQEDAPYEGPNVLRLPGHLDPGAVEIKAGERIAQLVFHRADAAWVEPALEIDMDTERGEAGFGSTGQ